MKIGTVTNGMNIYELSDALLCAPDSHPATWRKRVQRLFEEGRKREAYIVKVEHGDRLIGDKAWERQADAILKWANSLEEQ